MIDASVLLSASVTSRNTRIALLMDSVESGQVEMVVCEHLLNEVRRGFGKSYFRKRVTTEECNAYLRALGLIGLDAGNPVDPPRVVRDPKDDYLVALAIMADAAAIVTSDHDLLDHRDLDPPAMTASEACSQFNLSSKEGEEPRQQPPRSRYRRLGRDPHEPISEAVALRREEVARHQRTRLYGAMTEAVHKFTYKGTTVSHLIGLAGVSRKAFYGQFANKEECFLATFDISVARSKKRVLDAWQTKRGWANRVDNSCQAFVEDAARNPKSAHLVLVDGLEIGTRARERQILAAGAFERIIATAFSLAPDGIKLHTLGPRAIVGGGRYVTLARVRHGRTPELLEIRTELLDWISAYRHPMASRLDIRRTPSPWSAGAVPARFLAEAGPRSRTLSAITHLVLDEGLSELGDPQIAQFAGISTKDFHDLFSSKEQCFLAVLDGFINGALAVMREAAERCDSWPVAVCLATEALAGYLVAHPGLTQMVFINLYEVGPGTSDWQAVMLDRTVSLFRESAPEPRYGPALAPEAVVGAMWAILGGYAVRQRLRHLPALVDHLAFIVLAPYLGPEEAAHAIAAVAH